MRDYLENEQDKEEQKDGLDYLIELKEVADKAFMAHESLMVRLCEILKLDYTQATDEEVIQEVKRLKNVEVFVDAHHRDWHSYD